MPGQTKLDKCVEDVMATGKDKGSAFAICMAQFKKSISDMTPEELEEYKTFLLPEDALDSDGVYRGQLELTTPEGLILKYTPTTGDVELVSEGEKAVWTTASINNLPDSSFGYIESGGTKDSGGKTVPRSLRHLPYKNADGSVDLPHLRNALARLPQTTGIPDADKPAVERKLRAAAKAAGIKAFDDEAEDEKHITSAVPIYHEDIRDKVSSAMDKQAQDMGMSYSPYWIHRTAGDHVVAMHSREGYQKVPYSIDKNGAVTLGSATPVDKHTQFIDRPTAGKIYLKTEKDGKVRWMSISSTTDQDLDKQHFTEKAYAFSMKVHEGALNYGELRLEHHPASRVGICDGQFLVRDKSDEGRTLLVETGVFDETTRAKTCVNSLLADTVDKYKVSIGYRYNPAKLVDGAYTDHVDIFERSVTAYPANVKTAFGVVSPGISEEEVKWVMDKRSYDSIVALIGEEDAKKIADVEDDGLRALHALLDVKFKNTEEVPVGTNGQQAQEDHKDQKVEGASDQKNQAQVAVLPAEIEVELPDGTRVKAKRVEEAPAAAPQEDAVKAILAELKSIRTDLEQLKAGSKSQAATDPNAPRVVLYRATKAEGNVVDRNDPLLNNKSSNGGFFDDFIGGQPQKMTARPAVGG